MIPLTFATEVALKQSLTEHILWSIWYLLLIVGAGFVINYTRKNIASEGLATIIIISILTLFNILGFIGHLASLKYFLF